jgi:hypothetical protein
MRTKIVASVLFTMALMGNAYADTATCPPISTIKQTALSGGGFSYSAPGPNQRSWTGENQEAKEDYLESKYTDALYKESTKAVVCSYEGEGPRGVRVALRDFKDWKPALNTAWDKDYFCKNSDISKCSFEYTK